MSDTIPGAAGETALEADLATLKADVSRLTETLSALVSDSAATARNAAREGVDTAKAHVTNAADDLSETIEQNPLTAVLIALGIGYVVGALGRRR
ncbi:hypothetical protein [Methylopila sp. M107]|uniref:DUF883 family protein n=1 Tax=Methylopila sp. M107 TaxID=1101190 RepID=UPI00036001B6|nr:hypothetical protein [Methylopila sp. M107]